MEAKERFLQFVKEVESGCHEWQSTIKKDGYGSFWLQGKNIQAHRAAYIIFKGNIPKGKLILHTCDNRCCVNMEHLYAGTHKDNAQDMVKRGRHFRHTKLKVDDVREIRRLSKTGKINQSAVAKYYGVQQAAIWKIINYRTWSKV